MTGRFPALRSSAYGCRRSETHGTRCLRLLGSPPDLVHCGSIVQDPHPYAEPRRRRCPVHPLLDAQILYHKRRRNARGECRGGSCQRELPQSPVGKLPQSMPVGIASSLPEGTLPCGKASLLEGGVERMRDGGSSVPVRHLSPHQKSAAAQHSARQRFGFRDSVIHRGQPLRTGRR